jgi:hypothetical protein
VTDYLLLSTEDNLTAEPSKDGSDSKSMLRFVVRKVTLLARFEKMARTVPPFAFINFGIDRVQATATPRPHSMYDHTAVNTESYEISAFTPPFMMRMV